MHKNSTLTESGLVSTVPPDPGAVTGLLVADEAVIEMRVDDVTRALHRLSNASATSTRAAGHLALVPHNAGRAHRSVVGMRYLLPPNEGEGYWDFFSASEHLLISITDTVYKQDRWVPVDDSHYFKLRFMLSGRLLNRKLRPLLEGGQALAHISPRAGESEGGYFVEAGHQTRMVVLHGRKELLTEVLGFDAADVPPPLDLMLGSLQKEVSQKLAFGPKVFRAARDIVDSRHELPAPIRTPYLEAMAMQIICQVLSELANRNTIKRLHIRVSPRELNCIYQARDYLAQHFVAPPTISKLARMIGVNQTKLKAGFKQVVGMTIYHFIIMLRMEHASELLLSDENSISEVAYLVGYDYPANFTTAFKKHFGVLPRAWKSRHSRNAASAPR